MESTRSRNRSISTDNDTEATAADMLHTKLSQMVWLRVQIEMIGIEAIIVFAEEKRFI